MSKHQRGNREAKKPKKTPVPAKPITPDGQPQNPPAPLSR